MSTKLLIATCLALQRTNLVLSAGLPRTCRLRSRICFAALAAATVALHVGNVSGQLSPSNSSPAVAARGAGYVSGEMLVKLGSGPSRLQTANSPHNLVGATVLRTFPAVGWQHVQLPQGMSVRAGIQAYLALPGVVAAEPNYTLELAVVPNDPRYGTQWGLHKISAPTAWDTTTGSSNVVVAVIDEGVDYNHADLAANMWRNPGETGLDANRQGKATNGIDDDGDGYVDDVYGINPAEHTSDPMPSGWHGYHGTACAGIIGAAGNNALWLARDNTSDRMMALRPYNLQSILRASVAGVLESFEYVIQQRRRGVNVRVTSNSYGAPLYSQSLKDAINAAGGEGVLTVCAAGNDTVSTDAMPFSPASLDSAYVLSVAASDSADLLADFSNFGRSTVDLAAPGVDIVTTSTNSGYRTTFSGTSAACPHVAGAAALLLAVKPDATALDLKAALMQSVDQGAAFRAKVASNGRLNVFRALQVITNASLPSVVVGAFPASSLTHQDALIEIWFNRPMDRSSVEAAVQITPAVPGIFEWSDGDRILRLRSSAPLIRTNYSGRLLGTALDLAGSTIDGNFNRASEGSPVDDYVWNFSFPPRNDDFINATMLTGAQGSVKDNTTGASEEPDEPLGNSYGFAALGFWYLSVWYQWIAAQDGWMTFDTSTPAGIDTLVAAYTGSTLASLVDSAFDDNYGSKTGGRISFPVTAGTNYFIAVASLLGNPAGSFTLSWYPTPTPGFTSVFSPVSGIPGTKVTLSGTNFTGATAVLFNGASAVFTNALTNNLDLRITATVPPDATDGPITIRTPHGEVTTVGSFVVLPPPLLAQTSPAGGIEISWAATGRSTLLEAAWDVTSGVWEPMTDSLVQTNGNTMFRPVTTAGKRFYRLKKQ